MSASARLRLAGAQSVKDILLDGSVLFQMLMHNPFKRRFIDVVVPDAIGVNNGDWTTGADTQAGCRAPFDPTRILIAPQRTEQARQMRVQMDCSPLRIAEASGADEDVARIPVHMGLLHAILYGVSCW
jgi:hypothetical protein